MRLVYGLGGVPDELVLGWLRIRGQPRLLPGSAESGGKTITGFRYRNWKLVLGPRMPLPWLLCPRWCLYWCFCLGPRGCRGHGPFSSGQNFIEWTTASEQTMNNWLFIEWTSCSLNEQLDVHCRVGISFSCSYWMNFCSFPMNNLCNQEVLLIEWMNNEQCPMK